MMHIPNNTCCKFPIIKLVKGGVMNLNSNGLSNKLVLIRGLPGSGKSTLAREMEGYIHFEADMFLEINGVYLFDASKVKDAHDWCVASAKKALEQGLNVVVSNTFVKIWELQRYIDLGFSFKIYELQGKWINIHGVPNDKVEIMARGWQKIPDKWIAAQAPK